MLILLERYHQNCQAVLAAAGMNGLSSIVKMGQDQGRKEVNHEGRDI